MDEALRRYIADEIPGHLALMQLFIGSATEAGARDKLLSAINTGDGDWATKLRQLQTLWDQAPGSYALVSQIDGIANSRTCEAGHDGITEHRELFDRAVLISAEAGVALYSLGNRTLLDTITAEVVSLMEQLRLYSSASSICEIGCGAGRFLRAIAPRVRRMVGVDISFQMLRQARRELDGLNNVLLAQISGTGISMFQQSGFDLVLAIDSFPYIVQAGVEEQNLRDCARALAPGGRLLIMNFAYGAGLDLQRQKLAALADRFGFNIVRNGTCDLRSWDGTTFLLEKRAT